MDANNPADDKTKDHDLDGLPTYFEDANHDTVVDPCETRWWSPDTDGDGLCDGKLVVADGLYPNLPLSKGFPYIDTKGNVVETYQGLVVGGKLYADIDYNGVLNLGIDFYICGGGEDWNTDGMIAGDWGVDHVPGTGDLGRG